MRVCSLREDVVAIGPIFHSKSYNHARTFVNFNIRLECQRAPSLDSETQM